MPSAPCLEDSSACRGWRDSDERKAGQAGKLEGQHSWSIKKEENIAPWDVVTGLGRNDRLHPLAYSYTAAVAPYFLVVNRGLSCSMKGKVYSHYIDIFSFVGADVCPSGVLEPPTFSPMSQYYPWNTSPWDEFGPFETQVTRPYQSPVGRRKSTSPEEGPCPCECSLRAAAYVECSSKDNMRSVHAGFQMLFFGCR